MSTFAFLVTLDVKHQKSQKAYESFRIALQKVIGGCRQELEHAKLTMFPAEDLLTASNPRRMKGPLAAERLMEVKRKLYERNWIENPDGWFHRDWGGSFCIIEAMFKEWQSEVKIQQHHKEDQDAFL